MEAQKPWYKSKTLLALLPLVVLPLLDVGQHLIKENPLLVTLLAGLAAWGRMVATEFVVEPPPGVHADPIGFTHEPDDEDAP